jgi:hypothetical protein
LASNKDQHGMVVFLSNATTCKKSKGVTSRSSLISVSEAVLQSLHMAIALAARSKARYRSSSTAGSTDLATMKIRPSSLWLFATVAVELFFAPPPMLTGETAWLM